MSLEGWFQTGWRGGVHKVSYFVGLSNYGSYSGNYTYILYPYLPRPMTLQVGHHGSPQGLILEGSGVLVCRAMIGVISPLSGVLLGITLLKQSLGPWSSVLLRKVLQ